MISSKKIDIAYIKRETPLLISPIRNGGDIESIFCNYGEIFDSTYTLINTEKEKENPNAIADLKTKEQINNEKDYEANILDYEKNKYLVITISFIFDMYVDGSFKDGPYGIEKTKFNWKDKKDIIPALISSDDIRAKSNKIDLSKIDYFANPDEETYLCNPSSYDVDLLIYGNGIQYFKGNINYFTIPFTEIDILGYTDPFTNLVDENYDDDDEIPEKCKPREEKQRNSLKILYHIIFYGTKN